VASQIKTNAVGNMVASQLFALGRNLYARGLDQTDEYQSDREGVVLAARAGFDPYGLIAVLQNLRTATPDNPLFTLALATHPPAQARLDQLEVAMGRTLDPLAGGASRSMAQRLGGGAAAAQAAAPVAPAPAEAPPPKRKAKK